MDAIEKRARELLAAELGDYEAKCLMEGLGGAVTIGEALGAIIAALTPPEGYVLIQAGDARRLCAYSKHSPSSALAARRVEAILAARSEVHNVND